MYNPVQIPYLLSDTFRNNVRYTETVIPELQGFAVCLWEMRSLPSAKPMENIIVPDACIDLVVDYGGRQIAYSGMSRTDFHFPLGPDARFFGFRLRPGAFHWLTGYPATDAMDRALMLEEADNRFCTREFFSLPREAGKKYLARYLAAKSAALPPDDYIRQFEELYHAPVPAAAQVYRRMGFSPRQCQRLFLRHYGLPPKMVLSVIRFQQSLHMLAAREGSQSDILAAAGYYDQPHYIRDIKRNIGITPTELMEMAGNGANIQSIIPPMG